MCTDMVHDVTHLCELLATGCAFEYLIFATRQFVHHLHLTVTLFLSNDALILLILLEFLSRSRLSLTAFIDRIIGRGIVLALKALFQRVFIRFLHLFRGSFFLGCAFVANFT